MSVFLVRFSKFLKFVKSNNQVFVLTQAANPKIVVLQPNDASNWVIGSEQIIQWNVNYTESVKIDLSVIFFN